MPFLARSKGHSSYLPRVSHRRVFWMLTVASPRLVKEGLLFRSARPDDASLDDRRRLKEEFGIRSVMDLRTKTEHINAAKKRQRDLAAMGPVALAKSNDAFAEPLKIQGLRYLEIKLTGRRFERFLLSQLSWWSFMYVTVANPNAHTGVAMLPS